MTQKIVLTKAQLENLAKLIPQMTDEDTVDISQVTVGNIAVAVVYTKQTTIGMSL